MLFHFSLASFHANHPCCEHLFHILTTSCSMYLLTNSQYKFWQPPNQYIFWHTLNIYSDNLLLNISYPLQVLFQTPAQTMLERLPKPHKLKLVVRRCRLYLLRFWFYNQYIVIWFSFNTLFSLLSNSTNQCIVLFDVWRFGDGHVSTTAFDWKFEKHIDGNCLECDWNVDGVWGQDRVSTMLGAQAERGGKFMSTIF